MAEIHHSTPWRGARAQRAAAFAFGLSIGLAAAIGPAQAEKVGVAAAVNPDAFSSLSGTPNKQLNIGKSIFYNERINTTNSGLVQVLLVDGSTFTVGPNSNLVIDKFVYDPRKKTGELVATFSKGTMRFIGGKLSKNDGGVTVKTPSGALAIRGGMFQGSTQRNVYSFLFGHSLTFRGNNGQTQTVYETGYSLDLNGGRANVRPTTPEDTNAFMQALTSSGTNFGGGAGGSNNNPANPGGTQQLTNVENGADQEISDANFVIVQTSIQQQLARLNDLKNNNTPPQNNNTPPPPPSGGNEPEPVIKNGGEFNGYATGFLQTGEDGTGEPVFLDPGRSKITLDPKANTVRAEFTGLEVAEAGIVWVRKGWWKIPLPSLTVTQYNLGYFGSGDGSYIDDNTFLALGDDGTTNVVHTRLLPWYSQNTFTDANHLQGETPSGFGTEPGGLCKDCDFLRYGFWGADIQYANNEITEKMGGWWVATDSPVSAQDMPVTGTATYEGSAVGTLATKHYGQWTQELARGDLNMDWDFARRSGRLDIDNFGNEKQGYDKSFGGKMYAPGVTEFGGVIRGHGGHGFASGSFVGPRPGNAPAGVMGNFNIDSHRWKANGVFGGGNTRFDPNGSRPHISQN